MLSSCVHESVPSKLICTNKLICIRACWPLPVGLPRTDAAHPSTSAPSPGTHLAQAINVVVHKAAQVVEMLLELGKSIERSDGRQTGATIEWQQSSHNLPHAHLVLLGDKIVPISRAFLPCYSVDVLQPWVAWFWGPILLTHFEDQ